MAFFFNYAENNRSSKESPNQNTSLSWVNTLATNLTQSIINTRVTSQTPSSVYNLIESSLLALLAISDIYTLSLL